MSLRRYVELQPSAGTRIPEDMRAAVHARDRGCVGPREGGCVTTLKARPTVYRGVQMRSRLEARAAYFLDAVGVAWQYEPRAYKAGADEYLPDFQIAPHTFVEVKSAGVEWSESMSRALYVMGESDPDFNLWMLLSDGYAVLWKRHAEDRIRGFLSICKACHRWSVRDSSQSQLCSCGSVPIDARSHLEWQ